VKDVDINAGHHRQPAAGGVVHVVQLSQESVAADLRRVQRTGQKLSHFFAFQQMAPQAGQTAQNPLHLSISHYQIQCLN